MKVKQPRWVHLRPNLSHGVRLHSGACYFYPSICHPKMAHALCAQLLRWCDCALLSSCVGVTVLLLLVCLFGTMIAVKAKHHRGLKLIGKRPKKAARRGDGGDDGEDPPPPSPPPPPVGSPRPPNFPPPNYFACDRCRSADVRIRFDDSTGPEWIASIVCQEAGLSFNKCRIRL